MKRFAGGVVLCVFVAACGGSGSTTLPSSIPSPAGSQGGQGTSVPPTASPASTTQASVAPPTSTTGDVAFTLCPDPAAGASCPLPPAAYRARIHDAYILTIKDAGWQEERAAIAGDVEPTVILSRIDAADQRLTIDTGGTSVLLDDAGMAALVAGTAAFQSSAPVAAKVGTAVGYAVDLAPTGAEQVTIAGAGTYAFQAGHRYRLMALQVPMGEESGIKVIIVDAPTATFDAFLPLATSILETMLF